jgi:hypothetical protein
LAIIILNGFLIYDIIKSNKRHRELSLSYRDSVHSNKQRKSFKKLESSKLIIFFCKKKENSIDINSDKNETIEPCIDKNDGNKLNLDRNFSDKTLKNDVTIMLVGLIFVFLICQSPSTILRLITSKNLSIQFEPIYYSFLDVSNFLVVTNSTINCILYVMLGKKFRKEFLNTFLRRNLKNNGID